MKKGFYIVGLMILVIITLLILPIWNVDELSIEGNNYYSENEILQAISFKEGMHILKFQSKKVKEELSQLPYVRKTTIKYTFPNNIKIKLESRIPTGYIKFMDSYLTIDEEGYIVEQSNTKRLALPEIEGLKFNQFIVGEKLKLEKNDQLSVLKEMIQILNKYEFTSKVDVIEVSNIQQIHLYVDRLNVIIGNIRDFDKKVRYLTEVTKQYVMGILDLSLIEHKQAILKPIN